MKHRVYIAGPISKGDLCHNITQANEAFVKLAKAGFAPLCPQWSCFSGRVVRYGIDNKEVIGIASALPNELTHEEWLGVDLPWVEVSHAVLRLLGESVGADLEVRLANELEIPVFTVSKNTNLEKTLLKMKAHLVYNLKVVWDND